MMVDPVKDKVTTTKGMHEKEWYPRKELYSLLMMAYEQQKIRVRLSVDQKWKLSNDHIKQYTEMYEQHCSAVEYNGSPGYIYFCMSNKASHKLPKWTESIMICSVKQDQEKEGSNMGSA